MKLMGGITGLGLCLLFLNLASAAEVLKASCVIQSGPETLARYFDLSFSTKNAKTDVNGRVVNYYTDMEHGYEEQRIVSLVPTPKSDQRPDRYRVQDASVSLAERSATAVLLYGFDKACDWYRFDLKIQAEKDRGAGTASVEIRYQSRCNPVPNHVLLATYQCGIKLN